MAPSDLETRNWDRINNPRTMTMIAGRRSGKSALTFAMMAQAMRNMSQSDEPVRPSQVLVPSSLWEHLEDDTAWYLPRKEKRQQTFSEFLEEKYGRV